MAAETSEVTEDNLLAACDVAENAGVPPKVVAALRQAAQMWGSNQRTKAYVDLVHAVAGRRRNPPG
jgi:hypothetical protein